MGEPVNGQAELPPMTPAPCLLRETSEHGCMKPATFSGVSSSDLLARSIAMQYGLQEPFIVHGEREPLL